MRLFLQSALLVGCTLAACKPLPKQVAAQTSDVVDGGGFNRPQDLLEAASNLRLNAQGLSEPSRIESIKKAEAMETRAGYQWTPRGYRPLAQTAELNAAEKEYPAGTEFTDSNGKRVISQGPGLPPKPKDPNDLGPAEVLDEQ